MEPPSPGVAEANALVRCLESNEIHCTICPLGLRLQDWKKHIFDPTHLRVVEQFNLIFERTNGKVHCVPCNANFDWHDLRIHAKNHMILPWHKSDKEYDKYEIFFNNRIIEWNNIFQCCLCDATFSEWNIVFVHTTDPNHQNLCAEASTWIYEFPDTEVSYEFLVTEGIITHNEISLECRICGVKVAVSSLGKHAKGLMHRGNKSKFRLEFEEREVNEIGDEFVRKCGSSVESTGAIVNDISTNKSEVEVDFSTNQAIETDFSMNKQEIKTDFSQEIKPDFSSNKEAIDANIPINNRTNQVDSSTNKQTIDRESLSYLYIEKCDEMDSYCVICNCVMFHHSVQNHIKEQDHIDSERVYGCEKISWTNDNQYCCKICDRQLSGSAVVRSHVTGSKHLKTLHTSMQRRLQMNSKNDEISKLSEVETKENSIFNNDITMENGFYFCKLCTTNVTGLESLYEHIRGRKHLHKLSKKSMQTFPDRVDGFERFDEITDRCSIKPNDNDCSHAYEESSKKYCENIFIESQATTSKVHPPYEDEVKLAREQLPVRQNFEYLQRPNIDLQTRQKNHSDSPKNFDAKQFKWQMKNFDILRRPNINTIKKEKKFLNSLNKSKKPEVQQSSQKNLTDQIFSDYLVQENETDYRCKVCDRVIYGSLEIINDHLIGSLHTESLKKYDCDDCYMIAEDPNPQASPMVYILRKISDEISNCNVCDIELYSHEEIQQHISSTDHAAAMTKYGCDRILHEGGDDYYCVCCECKLLGPASVCTHVRGRRHYFGIRNLLDTKEVKRVKRNINALKNSEEQEINATLDLITDELSKLLEQKRLRESKSRRKRTNVE